MHALTTQLIQDRAITFAALLLHLVVHLKQFCERQDHRVSLSQFPNQKPQGHRNKPTVLFFGMLPYVLGVLLL
jgi:hypothetical protein